MRQVKTLGLLGTGVIGGGWAARALHFGDAMTMTISKCLLAFAFLGACVATPDDAADSTAVDPDVEQQPPAPPGEMGLGQTCIVGSTLPGESCQPGLSCVADAAGTRVGTCKLVAVASQPQPEPVGGISAE